MQSSITAYVTETATQTTEVDFTSTLPASYITVTVCARGEDGSNLS